MAIYTPILPPHFIKTSEPISEKRSVFDKEIKKVRLIMIELELNIPPNFFDSADSDNEFESVTERMASCHSEGVTIICFSTYAPFIGHELLRKHQPTLITLIT